jgi:hypothetical protein
MAFNRSTYRCLTPAEYQARLDALLAYDRMVRAWRSDDSGAAYVPQMLKAHEAWWNALQYTPEGCYATANGG